MKDKKIIKKNQHYVTQQYLKSWKGDTSIWTLFLSKKKIGTRNTTSVAKENYFYRLSTISSKQVRFIGAIIMKASHDSLKEMQLNRILGVFVEYSKLKQEFGKKPSNAEQKRLKLLEANYFEDMHERVENIGQKLIQCKSFNDFENIFCNTEERLKAITFITTQYYRTKRMKRKIESLDIPLLDFSNSNIWTILSFIRKQSA